MNLIAPPNLQPGDAVYLCAPAKAIEETYVLAAEAWLHSIGLKAIRSQHLTGRYHYFSGNILERQNDFQDGIDHPTAKAIWGVRGGYGCVQILDGLQWAAFLQAPKWVVGFSDVCVLHHKVQSLGYESIHGTMALNIDKNTVDSKLRLADLLFGNKKSFEFAAVPSNKQGNASGKLIGGNLSIIYSLLATPERYDFYDAILFVEDLAEHLYHIDRMLHALRKCGALNQIKGLIVGGMTDLEDTDVPFGQSINELILSHFQYQNIPICFDFPAGHIDDNHPLILGAQIELSVNENQCTLNYL